LLWFGSFVERDGGGWIRQAPARFSPSTRKRAWGALRRGGKRLFSGTPIRRRFEADPFFDFNAATIMMLVALGYYFSRLNDLSAPAIGTTSEFD
jgi:hypothetical protein